MMAVNVLITGAAGFVGRHAVNAALADGHAVRALVRAPTGQWSDQPNVEEIAFDMGGLAALQSLKAALDGCTAVIHAAASLGGNDRAQENNTIAPTKALIEAMLAVSDPALRPRLILVSSLSVYSYAALPEQGLLDELTPLETDAHLRDAYCRAKLAQEKAALVAAQTGGLVVRLLRPGVIYGSGRLWTARLGIAKGPIVIRIGGQAALPLTHVTHTASALVKAATAPLHRSDLSVAAPGGYLDAINIIEDEQPTQATYLSMIRCSGWPKIVIPLPWALLRRTVKLVSLAAIATPGLARRLPGLLRPENLHARSKPLRFSTARLHDRLGDIASPSLNSAITAAIQDGKKATS